MRFTANAILKLSAALLMGLCLTGCRTTLPNKNVSTQQSTDRRYNTVVWFNSAEAAAMYVQTFALARRALDEALARPSDGRPRAIITDIDETILDNSNYQWELIKSGQEYSTNSWKQWTARAAATPLPGASNFLHYARSRGVEIVYVTNRDQDEAEATLRNLRAAGFPNADAAHLLCKRSYRSKEERRQAVAQRYSVCLLMGDNLADLAAVFDSSFIEERAAGVANNLQLFGAQWIAFPNPMYGDWERAKPKQPSTSAQRTR